jgi:3-isopropylmalate/(R)-2-methylmalate dehydratase small subunit
LSQVIYKCGDDVSTDLIYPGRFMATVLPTETPPYAFADDPAFNARLKNGTAAHGVIAAGENFGCGSSREQAVSCLKGHEVTLVARSFARIFLQNAINLGLHVVICPELEAKEDDELEFSPRDILNRTSGKRFKVAPLPPAAQAIIDAGGLIPYARKRLQQKHLDG